MAGTCKTTEIARKLDELRNLPRQDLVERWIKAYGHPPPKGVKRGLLERACAYQIQAKRFGPLKTATRKKLLKLAAPAAPETSRDPPAKTELRPGARLLREWNGVTHQVSVMEKGFEWNGQAFGSLSSVARAITGARWSGPRFFGL